jgi:hypothetical protein
MAQELYSTMMKDNDWYAIWKSKNPGATAKAMQARFVNANWGPLIPQARATLAAMLAGPMEEGLKEQVLDALIKDNTLKKRRSDPHMLIGPARVQ